MSFAIVFIFGLVFGGLATAITYRFIIDDKYFQKYFECPICYHKLQVSHVIPVVSYFVVLQRHCLFCTNKISIVYPLVEIVCGILFVLTYLFFRDNIYQFAFIVFVVYALLVTSIIDMETYSVPNIVLIILFLLGILYCAFINKSGLLAIASGVSMFFVILAAGKIVSVILKKDSIGFGDVILLPVLTLFLEVKMIPYFITSAGLLGIIFGAMWKRLTDSEQFPFIPPIAIAFISFCFYSQINS
jgi:leader peptidase (prepilin peptidase) / N-methyltransferase